LGLFARLINIFAAVFTSACCLALLASCGTNNTADPVSAWLTEGAEIDEIEYRDKVHGSWVATMVANHSGLPIEGIYLDEPGPGTQVELVLFDQWSTDDDTHVEWLDLHILEVHGLDPTYEEIRDEWVDHLNGDIWVATRAARDLMDQGIVPPETGQPPGNPDGAWSMDAQLETELFGLINPGRPERARAQARFFAQVTNTGPAVAASAFYAHSYSVAFGTNDLPAVLAHARSFESSEARRTPRKLRPRRWHAALCYRPEPSKPRLAVRVAMAATESNWGRSPLRSSLK